MCAGIVCVCHMNIALCKCASMHVYVCVHLCVCGAHVCVCISLGVCVVRECMHVFLLVCVCVYAHCEWTWYEPATVVSVPKTAN